MIHSRPSGSVRSRQTSAIASAIAAAVRSAPQRAAPQVREDEGQVLHAVA